jgi:hypothetical protein
VLQVVPQVAVVVGRRLAVDSWRGVFAGALIRFLQEVLVDVVRETRQDPVWVFLGQCCYPLESQ